MAKPEDLNVVKVRVLKPNQVQVDGNDPHGVNRLIRVATDTYRLFQPARFKTPSEEITVRALRAGGGVRVTNNIDKREVGVFDFGYAPSVQTSWRFGQDAAIDVSYSGSPDSRVFDNLFDTADTTLDPYISKVVESDSEVNNRAVLYMTPSTIVNAVGFQSPEDNYCVDTNPHEVDLYFVTETKYRKNLGTSEAKGAERIALRFGAVTVASSDQLIRTHFGDWVQVVRKLPKDLEELYFAVSQLARIHEFADRFSQDDQSFKRLKNSFPLGLVYMLSGIFNGYRSHPLEAIERKYGINPSKNSSSRSNTESQIWETLKTLTNASI